MSDILKENYQKALNKLTLLFFFFESSGQSYQKQWTKLSNTKGAWNQ